MKIGFFTDGYLPQINGVATSVEELKNSLEKEGNEVYIIAPDYPKYKDKDKKIFRLKSFRLFKNPELRLSYMFPDKIFQKVLKIDFDIIHGFSGGSIPALGLALAKFKKKPYVFTYNTRLNHYTHYVMGGKLIRPKAVEKVVELYCNVCNYVIAPADYVKKELIEFGVKKPIAVIPNGIDIEKFKSGERGYLRKKLGLLEKDKIVLYLGRLAREKSVDFVIKAFARLSKLSGNYYLVIVGDGPHRETLEKLVEDLDLTGKVIFLGFVEFKNVPKVYSDSDVFAFASETETQGMVVLEAMASGLSVLVTKDKVFEQVIENGKDGIMVERNQKKFAEELRTLLTDDKLRKTIGQNARKKAQQFSLDEIAKKFDTLYKSLI